MRSSELRRDDYLDHFFDTGHERQQSTALTRRCVHLEAGGVPPFRRRRAASPGGLVGFVGGADQADNRSDAAAADGRVDDLRDQLVAGRQ